MESNQRYIVAVPWRTLITLVRLERDLTKEQVATQCTDLGHPLTRQTLWRIETGRVQPQAATREVLTRVLNLDKYEMVLPTGAEQVAAL